MPLDKLVLILVIVVSAAAVTVWLGATLAASLQTPLAMVVLIPSLLVLYIIWRVIAQRLRSSEDDHYDRTPR